VRPPARLSCFNTGMLVIKIKPRGCNPLSCCDRTIVNVLPGRVWQPRIGGAVARRSGKPLPRQVSPHPFPSVQGWSDVVLCARASDEGFRDAVHVSGSMRVLAPTRSLFAPQRFCAETYPQGLSLTCQQKRTLVKKRRMDSRSRTIAESVPSTRTRSSADDSTPHVASEAGTAWPLCCTETLERPRQSGGRGRTWVTAV